jgi:hypothetical protein
LKTDKKSTSSEGKKKKKDEILFEVGDNLDIKKSTVDKPNSPVNKCYSS